MNPLLMADEQKGNERKEKTRGNRNRYYCATCNAGIQRARAASSKSLPLRATVRSEGLVLVLHLKQTSGLSQR